MGRRIGWATRSVLLLLAILIPAAWLATSGQSLLLRLLTTIAIVLGYVVLAMDVARRKSVEATLQRSEDRYRSFIAHSTEGIWRFESEDPTLINLPEDQQIERWYRHHFLAECNHAMARMYGYQRAEEFVGARLNQLLVTANPANWEFHRQFIRNGYRMTDAESCEFDRDGKLKYFLNNFVGTVEDGKLVRIWGTQRDITAQKLFEIERARLLELEQLARAEAERANRAKDEFIAVLSHELRTPLTPVLLGVSMLESRPDLPADVRDDLHNMRTDIELEARLIDDLLDLTRIRLGKLQLHPEQVDAHELIRRTVEMCGRNGGARVTLDLGAQHHHLRADSVRLQQVLWNLVNNALKFTPLDGHVTVRTSNHAPAANADQSGPTLAIGVIDTGIGFDPAAGTRLFDAFDQGDLAASRRFGGLGLGLAISRALTQASGGSIHAQSDGHNQGATFTLQLPTITLCPDQPPRSVCTEQTARPLRLLLVEDHDSTRRLLTKLLQSFGHEIAPASCVAQAMALADTRDFDLIISDIGLPDGSGHDLMRKLRDRFHGIALTGYGMEEDIQRSSDAGFLDHLTKPVDARKLEQAIDRAIRLSHSSPLSTTAP